VRAQEFEVTVVFLTALGFSVLGDLAFLGDLGDLGDLAFLGDSLVLGDLGD